MKNPRLNLCARQLAVVASLLALTAGGGFAATNTGESLAAPLAGPQITLLDPVPALLSGSQVTSNYNTLATKGRPIMGAAADGITESVIRFHAGQVGQQFTITLLNDQGQQSSSVIEDGGLGSIGSTNFTQSQITVSAVSTSKGAEAFAIYQAPVDFPRPEGQDASATTRSVSLQVQAMSGGSPIKQTVTLLRAPIVLVHGLWSDPTTWDGFTPFIDDARFSINRADYSASIGTELTSYTPSYPPEYQGSVVALSTAASLGYSYNAPTVLNQISNFILQFKKGANPASLAVADVQADLVVHSMGGDVTRWLAQLPNFLTNNTFKQGEVHKVVTIGTPHLGSPLATDLLQNDNSCSRDILATLGDVSFNTATLLGKTTDGAINDLQGDGFGGGLSKALMRLENSSPHPFPFALIDGLASQSQFDAVDNSLNALLLRLLCAGDPLANHLTGTGWPELFGQGNDTIVPDLSETNGGRESTVVNGVVHSSGSVTLGFGPPAELDAAGGIPDVVVNLLNTNVTSSAYVRF